MIIKYNPLFAGNNCIHIEINDYNLLCFSWGYIFQLKTLFTEEKRDERNRTLLG